MAGSTPVGRSPALPPGPRDSAFRQAFHFARRPLEYLEGLRDRYGDIFSMRVLGSRPWVMLSTPAHLRSMYSAGSEQVVSGQAAGSVFAPLTGWLSTLTLDGEAHRKRRRLMLPTLALERVLQHAPLVRELAQRELGSWPLGRPFALHPSLQRITLQVIHQAIFGIQGQVGTERLARQVGELAEIGMNSPLLLAPFLRWNLGRWSPWGRILRLVRDTDRELYQQIERCRQRSAAPGEERDVISSLLAIRDENGEGLSPQELRDELIALLLAGHETTHTALVWIFEKLLAHPEVVARVNAEIATASTAQDLLQLPYLDAVIREGLRASAISPICGARLVVSPIEIGDYLIPAGAQLTNCTYLLHRRPDLYPDPLAFRPERFLAGPLDPYAWTTFGGGDRRCLGSNLALLEIKVVLATVLPQAALRLAAPPVRAVPRGVHMAPQDGLQVVLDGRRTA